MAATWARRSSAALLASGWAEPGELAVVEALEAQRQRLGERFPGVVVTGEPPPAAEGAVLAVKPGDIEAACRLAAAAGAARVLSIAAGVSIARLEAALGPGVAVVRAMPNTPALVGAGAAAIAGGAAATEDDLAWAEGILGSVGTVVRVPEHLLDAVTGLSGSGPAYVFLMAEALIDGGVAAGLPPRRRRRPDRAAPGRLGPAAGGVGRAPGPAARPGHVAGGHHRGRAPRARAGRDAGGRHRVRPRRHAP